MVDYKDTKRYSQVPDSPTSVYVGVPGQTDHSGKSTRVDDNFTNIAQNIGNGQAYLPGDGIDITSNVVSLKYDDNTLKLNGNGVLYVPTISYLNLSDKLVAGNANVTIEGNVISTENTTYEEATTLVAGLMSAEDKYKLDQLDTFTLPTASTTELGGVKIDDSTIKITQDGTIYAVLQPYPDATSSASGLMTPVEKEKLGTVHTAANYIYAGSNGKLSVNETFDGITVYTHPAYTPIEINSSSGKILNGVTVDSTGHVTNISYTSLSSIIGVSITDEDAGTAISSLTVSQSNPNNIIVSRVDLADMLLGSVDTITSATSYPEATDSLQTALRKVWNNSNTRLIYKGTVGTNGTYNALPVAPSDGDVYKVINNTLAVDGDTAVYGDLLIYYFDLGGWTIVPAGNRPDGNTWRPIYVDHVQKKEASSSTGYIDFVGGDNIALAYANGAITISYTGGETAGEYNGGIGISVDVDPETGYNLINLQPATIDTLGGVKIGTSDTNLYTDPNGILRAVDTKYSQGSGILISGTTINADFGDGHNNVARGDHSHLLGNLSNVSFSGLTAGDILKYDGTNWYNSIDAGQPITINSGSPISASKTINFTGDGENIAISATDTNSTTTISIEYIGDGGGGDYSAGNGLNLDENNEFSVAISNVADNIAVIANDDGIYVPKYEYTLPMAVDANTLTPRLGGVIPDGTTVTINNLGILSAITGSGSGGATYVGNAPIAVNNVNHQISLLYDNTFGLVTVDNIATLTSYGRPIYVDEDGSSDTDSRSVGNNALEIKAGTNVSLALSNNNGTGISTLTINASGGGGSSDVASLDDLSDVAIPSTVPDGYVLKCSSNIWSPSPDTNTTYIGGNGISVTDTSDTSIKAISAKLKSGGGLGYDTNSDELKVSVDGSSIRINPSTNQLYVSLSSALVTDDSTAINYTDNTIDGVTPSGSLRNNTIYRFYNSNITKISLDAAYDMSYCTVCFRTPSTIPAGFWNVSWRCVGNDCSSGSFNSITPSAEYQVAIDNLNGVYTCYILKVAINL